MCAGEVFDRVANPTNLALVADGMHKVIFDSSCCLLSMGLACKDAFWGKGQGHSTSYIELVVGLFRSEAAASYECLINSLIYSIRKVTGADVTADVFGNLHGDFADGLERARRNVLPGATRRVGATIGVGRHLSMRCTLSAC